MHCNDVEDSNRSQLRAYASYQMNAMSLCRMCSQMDALDIRRLVTHQRSSQSLAQKRTAWDTLKQQKRRVRSLNLNNQAVLQSTDTSGQDRDNSQGSAEVPGTSNFRRRPADVIDKQVYRQVAASRNRLSQQLSSKNKYIQHLERKLDQQYQAISDAHTALQRVHKELEALKRLSEVAMAAAAFAVEKKEMVSRSQRLVQRADSLQKGIDKETQELDRLVLRRIPVSWYGVASDVKLLGDFDSWTRGFSLSPSDIQDQTFTKFTAVISLLPGRYLVKFKIDDAYWRLAPDWPTNDSPDGSTNNVLVVA